MRDTARTFADAAHVDGVKEVTSTKTFLPSYVPVAVGQEGRDI